MTEVLSDTSSDANPPLAQLSFRSSPVSSDVLEPNQCAREEYRDLVVVIAGETSTCYERQDLLSRLREYDYLTKVVLERFPKVQIFQEFTEGNEKVLRPLRGTVEEYLARLISSGEVLSHLATRQLGKGSFGVVWQYGDIPIVVKNIDSDQDLESIVEFSIMKIVESSPCCVLTPYDVRFEGEKSRIYLPKMKSDLYKYMRFEYDPDEQSQILHDLIKGMYYVNRKGFLHRDLKFENCLITEQGEAKVADFGLGCFYPYQLHRQKYHILTWTYRAPEVFLHAPYSSAIDVFSLGMMALETLTRGPHHISRFLPQASVDALLDRYPSVPPPEASSLLALMGSLYDLITDAEISRSDLYREMYLPHVNSSDYYFNILVMQMLCNLPDIRPTLPSILQHPYFHSYREEDQDVSEFSIANVMMETPCFRNTGNSLRSETMVTMLEKTAYFPASDLLGLAILNKFACTGAEMKSQIISYMGALYIANKLSNISNQYANLVPRVLSEERMKSEALNIAVTLDFQFNHLTPLHFFREKLSTEFYRDLLYYELAPIQPFHAYSVAQYLAKKHSYDLVVEFPFQPVDEAEMEKLLQPSLHEERIRKVAKYYSGIELANYPFNTYGIEPERYDQFLKNANLILIPDLSRDHVLEELNTFERVLEHVQRHGIGAHNYLEIGSTLVYNVTDKTTAALPIFKQIYDLRNGGRVVEEEESEDEDLKEAHQPMESAYA